MLKAYAINKSYGNTKILKDVDITVEPGEITVLIGPSGSGKTTLLKCLSLLEHPDQGTISLDGIHYNFPIPKNKQIKLPYPNLTVVFQQLFLWPHLTLRQNIILPIKKQLHKHNHDYLNELIELFDMVEFIDRYPNEVSLGQKQRTALVRALVLKPSYILLDEITSALDVEQVSKVLSHLQTLCQMGIGILIITHLIGFARRAGHNIVFLDKGKVLEAGGKEVIDSPKNGRLNQFLSVIESAR